MSVGGIGAPPEVGLATAARSSTKGGVGIVAELLYRDEDHVPTQSQDRAALLAVEQVDALAGPGKLAASLFCVVRQEQQRQSAAGSGLVAV